MVRKVPGQERARVGRRRLRLLLVVDSLDGGGAERHVVELAKELKARHHEVTVACSVGGVLAPELEDAGIALRPLMGGLVKRSVSVAFAAQLRRLVRRQDFDLVHAHIYASAAAAALATVRTGTPLVVTEHTEAPWRSRRARWASRWLYRRCHRVIVVSAAIERLLRDRYGVPPSRVRRITPAVTIVRPAASGKPSSLPPACDGRPIVGCVARLQQSKGVDVFLRAAAQVADAHPLVQFLVVGDGPHRDELESLASSLGLASRLHFLGFRRDTRAIMEQLDVLVVPSRTDGSPLVVFEAMTAGVPVVASAVGGIPDQVRHGDSGLLVPPDDVQALVGAVGLLLGDADQADQFGRAGRRLVDHFSHDVMVDRIEAVYDAALRSPRLLPIPSSHPRPRVHQSL